MRVIGYILRKEFLQIFRNKGMLPIIFVMPVIQLLVLVNAADFEIRHIKYKYIDLDRSSTSRTLLQHISASPRFDWQGSLTNARAGMSALDDGTAQLLIRIPEHFSRDLNTKGQASISIDLNGIDGQVAGLATYYLNRIIIDYNTAIVMHRAGLRQVPDPPIITAERYWYNPSMIYSSYMVPGLLVILVTMVGGFLSSMNIVREKEVGTIEQINVTPIKKHQFIIGKLLPFWVIGLFELALGLLLGWLIYHIPVNGNLAVLFSYAAIYLLVVLGLGLLMSTLTRTQQQAMFSTWFFMVIFILMSGLFTPIENMPLWAQKITWFNPVAYFVRVVRMVLLKGSGFGDMGIDFLVTAIMALFLNLLAVFSYRKSG